MQIAIYLLIFWIGITFGAIIWGFLRGRLGSYDGTIFVVKEDDKLLYSIELAVNPEQIQYEAEILLKVEVKEEESEEVPESHVNHGLI